MTAAAATRRFRAVLALFIAITSIFGAIDQTIAAPAA